MNGVPLETIKVSGTPVTGLPIVYGEEEGFGYRAYLKTEEGTPGFELLVVEFVSGSISTPMNFISVVEVMLVEARYDGIRHVHFNRECPESPPGYWYYPDWKDIVKIFQLVEELESKYCDTDL